MSKNVNVLAVMDLAIERVARPHTEGLHEARAAVAELIEAVEEVANAERFDSDVESWVQYSLRFRASKHRLSSALAGVKGA